MVSSENKMSSVKKKIFFFNFVPPIINLMLCWFQIYFLFWWTFQTELGQHFWSFCTSKSPYLGKSVPETAVLDYSGTTIGRSLALLPPDFESTWLSIPASIWVARGDHYSLTDRPSQENGCRGHYTFAYCSIRTYIYHQLAQSDSIYQ